MNSDIEKSFVDSWQSIEEFYLDDLLTMDHWQWIRPLTNLISNLRQKGYDRKLRAGQSMYILILSRSKDHGLRPDQSLLSLVPLRDGGLQIQLKIGDNISKKKISEVIFCKELKGMLERLEECPVD